MQLFADHHIHSLYSDGRAGIRELAQRAQEIGLEEITIADHGPNNIGTGVKNVGVYLKAKEEAQGMAKDFPGLKLQVGAEANVISLDGKIDVPEDIYQQLDLLIIGLHPYIKLANWRKDWPYITANQLHTLSEDQRQKAIELNTRALIQAIYRHKPDVVAHPGLGLPIDLEEVARVCAETNTAYEINTGHSYQNVADIIRAAKTGVKFMVNSDAHFVETVGKLDYGMSLLKRAKLPPEQVINARQ